jgi:hypothetical protein
MSSTAMPVLAEQGYLLMPRTEPNRRVKMKQLKAAETRSLKAPETRSLKAPEMRLPKAPKMI